VNFGQAIEVLKAGGRVARGGWNGRGMYLELQRPDANSKMSLPYIYMRTVQGDLVPWLASQTDVLGEDWSEVGRPAEGVHLRAAAVVAGKSAMLLVLCLLAVLVLAPAVALAQTTAPAASSPLSGLLAQFLTPAGIATIVGTLASIIFGIWKLSDLRKKQVSEAIHNGFHLVEDLAVTTDNTIDDKVAAGLKAIDDYMAAHGWRALKPDEVEQAKLGFSALNGQSKVAEKAASLAAAAAATAVKNADPPAP